MIPGEENSISTSEEGQDISFYVRSGKRYDPTNVRTEPVKRKTLALVQKKRKTVRLESPVNEPVTENEVNEFLKFLKHREYSVVEQRHKQPTRISVLALLLSSETHCSALMKVLNKTYVTNDISVKKLDRLVNNISADNFIFFNDDKIPLGGMGSTKALYITTHCKGYTSLGSALNVLPLSILNTLLVDSSHMKTCQNIVRAFDGTERRVMGMIEIPLLIGPNTYEVDFLVMDIKPWIHSAGVVPSSLHQKLKLVTEDRLVTINAEKDIIAFVTSDVLYIGADDETIEKQDPSAQNIQNYEDGLAVDGWEISLTWEGAWKISTRKGWGTHADGQTRSLWLGVQAKYEAKEEGDGEETRKKKNATKWWRGQMGTDDLSPYIQNIRVRRNHLF
ncbi:hypothetical protein EPI10_030854 [Gossypium australe]|uniref:Uncharacterized protein n=1 Tax=Gossypium australe TaxID=47621 RepID=A0A5B6X269_9ROSI|nr:hypothetical protein EPI10_030854 [Gossypium australe]